MAPDPKTPRAFHELGEELAGKGAQVSKMFGMPTLTVGRKAFAGVPDGGGLVFKLSPDDVQAALKLRGAELFDPGHGSPNEGMGGRALGAHEAVEGPRGLRLRVRRYLGDEDRQEAITEPQ
ncbi:MAG TPA: hypothetical protein VGR41_00420 [Actinomycetota bacterium]|jgi:hypothetical protein|nr:hypothetical protein [Actinomycetota bacterium]